MSSPLVHMHDCSPTPSDADTTDSYTTNNPNAFAHDAYPPISPGSAASIMGQFQDLDETIRGMAYGLISTVHKCTISYKVGKVEANARIKERDEEITGLQVRLAQLEGAADAYEKPEGFSINDGRITNLIPLNNGLFIPTKWVRQCSDTRVELLAGREEGEHWYVVELYADPDYTLDALVGPLPIWFLQLLCGPSTAFLTLTNAVEKLCDWQLEAEVYRYRKLDDCCCDITAQLDSICVELDLQEEHLASCCYRIEVSRLADRVKNLEGHLFPHRYPTQLGRSSTGKKPKARFMDDLGESF
jgi:hypothetical protein